MQNTAFVYPELPRRTGGAFLIEAATPDEIFTPEDFTEEHRAIARTAEDFWNRELRPGEGDVRVGPSDGAAALRKASELGLGAVLVPERYGGMEMDLIAAVVAAEGLAKDESFAACHGAHSCAAMPLLMFGNDEQKQRCLPLLARGEWIGALCLSEPQGGSDLRSLKSRADLVEDGSHYVLNGRKAWVTNGGTAGLYIVFARAGGEKLSAFLVERSRAGVNPGPDERMLGVQRASTAKVSFDNVRVPATNLLGEVGAGRTVALRTLSYRRLYLAASAVGAAKQALAISVQFAKQREILGKPLAELGLVRHKLAEAAVSLYAAESMCYRVAAMMQGLMAGLDWSSQTAAELLRRAAGEFAAECCLLKAFSSEVAGFVADEAVQLHGAEGCRLGCLAEQAYRDARVLRLAGGTSEINRLSAAAVLLKRSQKGLLGLPAAVKKFQSELLGELPPPEPSQDPSNFARRARQAFLFLLGAAFRKYPADLAQQQEIMALLADLAINVLALESVQLRASCQAAEGRGQISGAIAVVFARRMMDSVERGGRELLGACAEGDQLRVNLAILRRLVKCEPANGVVLRRRIAAHLLHAERYAV